MNNTISSICTYALIITCILVVVSLAAPDHGVHTGNAFIDKASSSSTIERLIAVFN